MPYSITVRSVGIGCDRVTSVIGVSCVIQDQRYCILVEYGRVNDKEERVRSYRPFSVVLMDRRSRRFPYNCPFSLCCLMLWEWYGSQV